MPNPRQTRDLDDPEFPHGEKRGYDRGCRRTCCMEARRAWRRASDHKLRLRNLKPGTRVDAGPTRERVALLLAAGPYSNAEIGHAAGLEDTTIHNVRTGRRTKVTYATERAVLAVTPELLARLAAKGDGNRVDPRPVREHLRTLLEAEYARPTVIAKIAGVDYDTVDALLTCRYRSVQAAIARKILAVTPQTVYRHAKLLPARRPRQQSGALRALGFPGVWQARKLGYSGEHGIPFASARVRWVRAGLAERMAALAAEIGDRWADPARDGIAAHVIDRTRREARAAGWYPPACYDETGVLIEGAIRRDEEQVA